MDKKKSGLAELFKNKKWLEISLIIVVLIVIVLLYVSTLDLPDNNIKEDTPIVESQSTDLESRLEEILSSIEGAGKVKVLISYKDYGEMFPAQEIDRQENESSKSSLNGEVTSDKQVDYHSSISLAQQDGGQKPIILKQNVPEIRGVIVVAEGADDFAVHDALLRAIQTLLNLTSSQIDIFKATYQGSGIVDVQTHK